MKKFVHLFFLSFFLFFLQRHGLGICSHQSVLMHPGLKWHTISCKSGSDGILFYSVIPVYANCGKHFN